MYKYGGNSLTIKELQTALSRYETPSRYSTVMPRFSSAQLCSDNLVACLLL